MPETTALLTENPAESESARSVEDVPNVILGEDDPEEIEKEEDPDKGVSIKTSQDAYDAVVAAAFDGIRIKLPSNEKGELRMMRLHPIVVWGFCFILFKVQLSCLSSLVLDMDLRNVWTKDGGTGASWDGYDQSPSRQMKMMVRTIMVCLLQMVGFKELLGSLRPMCFILNPVTWFELHRPSTEGKGKLFHAGICAPICFAAQCMQFGIAYYVLIISMSVIILAPKVQDMIFNGLVVVFLADLDEYAWAATAAIFHMDENHFEEFKFKLRPDPNNSNSTRSSDPNNSWKEDPIVKKWRAEAKKSEWKFWFYRGYGGKASILENWIVFSLLTVIYVRQLFMYAQAIHTGTLPVARDVCALYRGLNHPDQFPGSALLLRVVDFFTFINYPEILSETVKNANFTEECLTQEIIEGPFDHYSNFTAWWPLQMYGGMACVFLVFLLPQIGYANFESVLRFLQRTVKSQEELIRGASGHFTEMRQNSVQHT